MSHDTLVVSQGKACRGTAKMTKTIYPDIDESKEDPVVVLDIPRQKQAPRYCEIEPTIFEFPSISVPKIEVSVHSIPKQWKPEFSFIPKEALNENDVYLVLTCQPSSLDLLKMTAETAKEKDDLLENFYRFSEALKQEIMARSRMEVTAERFGIGSMQKLWCDYIDPCSGLLAHTKNCHLVFPEVVFFEKLRRFNSQFLCGRCKVVIHPKWSARFYPATFMTTARPEIVQAALDSLLTKESRLQRATDVYSGPDVNPSADNSNAGTVTDVEHLHGKFQCLNIS